MARSGGDDEASRRCGLVGPTWPPVGPTARRSPGARAVVHDELLGYVTWFNAHRPHQGLGQRTPDEIHFGRDTRPQSVPLRGELVAELVDGDLTLPVLRLRRTA